MPLQVTAAHYTATGLREQNEDFAGLVTPAEPELSRKGIIAAIADGVSGSDGGGEAAEYCVRQLLTDYYATPGSWPITQSLDTTIKSLNAWVVQQGAQGSERHGMATTLTALVVHGSSYHFSHVGDTRLYLLREGEMNQLSADHVSKQPERTHVLTRAIGMNAQLSVDHGSGDVRTGDIFLLATDGVWSAMPEHDLQWHLSELIDDKRSAENTAKLLADAALAGGSRDNVSALVLRVDQLPQARLSHGPDDPAPTSRAPIAPWKIIGWVSLALVFLFCLSWMR